MEEGTCPSLESVPETLRAGVDALWRLFEWKDSVFVMLPYAGWTDSEEYERAVQLCLESYGLVPHVARRRSWSDDLWSNVQVLLRACRYGVALLPLVSDDEGKAKALNENVLIETGYMLALGKRVLLLKDPRIERLPADISHLVHRTYDPVEFRWSITQGIIHWVEEDIGLFDEISIRPEVRSAGRDYLVYVGGSCDWPGPNQEAVKELAFRLGMQLISKAFYVLGGMNDVGASAIKGAVDQMSKASWRYTSPQRHAALFGYGPRSQQVLERYFDGKEPPVPVVLHKLNRQRYSRFVAHESDAMIFLSGRNGTSEEFDCAVERGRVVIPVGATGDVAAEVYTESSGRQSSVCGVDISDDEWELLGDERQLESEEGIDSLARCVLRILTRARRKSRIQRRSPRTRA